MPQTETTIKYTFSRDELKAALCQSLKLAPDQCEIDMQIGAVVRSGLDHMSGPPQYELKRVVITLKPEVTT